MLSGSAPLADRRDAELHHFELAFAAGIASGGALDGYQFVADTATVNGGTDQAVTVAAVPVTVSIVGTAQEGQTLTANAMVAGDSDATFTYQWQQSLDGGPPGPHRRRH